MSKHYHLAQLNIAHFMKPAEHPDNADFLNNVDWVNASAESQPGFVWRYIEDEHDAVDLQVFDDPNIAINLSVWTSMDALTDFVYRNDEHLAIMRRRREWFKKTKFYLVLWWVKEGYLPSLLEAKQKLAALEANGPSEQSFTFAQPFPPPGHITPT